MNVPVFVLTNGGSLDDGLNLSMLPLDELNFKKTPRAADVASRLLDEFGLTGFLLYHNTGKPLARFSYDERVDSNGVIVSFLDMASLRALWRVLRPREEFPEFMLQEHFDPATYVFNDPEAAERLYLETLKIYQDYMPPAKTGPSLSESRRVARAAYMQRRQAAFTNLGKYGTTSSTKIARMLAQKPAAAPRMSVFETRIPTAGVAAPPPPAKAVRYKLKAVKPAARHVLNIFSK